jgi:uncharacterized protein (TIGR02246 family)
MMPPMDADRDAIRALLARYCHLLDDGRFDEWGRLFTEDAALSVMGGTHAGRDAIVAFISAAQGPDDRGRHLISEPDISLEPGAGTASVATDYAFIARGAKGLAVTSAGRYHDELVRTDDGWRFRSRQIVFVGDEPPS